MTETEHLNEVDVKTECKINTEINLQNIEAIDQKFNDEDNDTHVYT